MSESSQVKFTSEDPFTFRLVASASSGFVNEASPIFVLQRDLFGGAKISVTSMNDVTSFFLSPDQVELLTDLIETTLVGPIDVKTKLVIYKFVSPDMPVGSGVIIVGKDLWNRIWIAPYDESKVAIRATKFYLTAKEWYNYVIPLQRFNGLK